MEKDWESVLYMLALMFLGVQIVSYVVVGLLAWISWKREEKNDDT